MAESDCTPDDTICRQSPTPAETSSPLLPDHDLTTTRNGDNTNLESLTRKPLDESQFPRAYLPASRNFFWLVFLYSALYISSWVIICRFSTVFKPKTVNESSKYHSNGTFEQAKRCLKAARILQAIVAVATIPLTSAVCSRAAVVYCQFTINREDTVDKSTATKGKGLSLRQTMALADECWSDPYLLMKLFRPGRWRLYGTRLLGISILVVSLGALLSPLQQLLISYKTIKVYSYGGTMRGTNDIVNLCKYAADNPSVDSLTRTVRTRSKLESTRKDYPLYRLWAEDHDCDGGKPDFSRDLCRTQNAQFWLRNLTEFEDPFLSTVPFGFHTGLLRQYAPRFNSTALWQSISKPEYPQGCENQVGALHIGYNYSASIDLQGLSTFEACMSADMRRMPWKPQRSSQEFREELFLRFATDYELPFDGDGISKGEHFAKITVDTTAGYFELPNYKNKGQPGPLLDFDPILNNDHGGQVNSFQPVQDPPANAGLNTTDPVPLNNAKGPLFDLAIALFGSGSLADSSSLITRYMPGENGYRKPCLQMVPLADFDIFEYQRFRSSNCVRQGIQQNDTDSYAAAFTWSFVRPSVARNLVAALNAAAFLSTEAWATEVSSLEFEVHHNMGVDLDVADLSLAAMIVLNILIAAFLGALWSLSFYSSRTGVWTSLLDSFAMMRIGAALGSRKLPLLASHGTDQIKILDELPGWIGDTVGRNEDEAGKLIWGSGQPIKNDCWYYFYRATSSEVVE